MIAFYAENAGQIASIMKERILLFLPEKTM